MRREAASNSVTAASCHSPYPGERLPERNAMTQNVRLAPRLVAMLGLILGCAFHAQAATISVGTRISLSPTEFVVPIEISDAVDVISWEFDLTYDPTDVQINTSCDPFSGDVYCSLLTGPVTEGDFFASGAPFNLLNPGFIDLDPTTFAQTGLLFGVQGAFGGVPPFPSGAGVLAFVQFTLLGDGASPIEVNGSAVSAVPEPGTLALLASGLLLPAARRRLGRAGRRRSPSRSA